LVHKVGHEQPKTTKELLDMVTRHALGEEAVGAAFTLVNVGTAANIGWAAPVKTTIKSTRKGVKTGKTPTALVGYNG
jgi:hypothetical protein